MVTDPRTDFWRTTHYAFVCHSGHVFARDVAGCLTTTLRVRADYEQLYDQAGLMVLVDDANWVKTGIEMSDGAMLLGSVLTRGQSDWATGHS